MREGDAEEEDGNNDGDLMEFFLGASARSEHVAFAAERGWPNACMGPLERGPFYAVRVVAAAPQ